jgi:hypothetical protein
MSAREIDTKERISMIEREYSVLKYDEFGWSKFSTVHDSGRKHSIASDDSTWRTYEPPLGLPSP